MGTLTTNELRFGTSKRNISNMATEPPTLEEPTVEAGKSEPGIKSDIVVSANNKDEADETTSLLNNDNSRGPPSSLNFSPVENGISKKVLLAIMYAGAFTFVGFCFSVLSATLTVSGMQFGFPKAQIAYFALAYIISVFAMPVIFFTSAKS